MTASEETFRTPYTRAPGGSTPGPDVTPAEGKGEIRVFFWAMVVNTVIIAVGGLVAWFYVH